MSNESKYNPFPELEDWDDMIQSRTVTKDILWPIKATHKLVLSLANLRASVSSQVHYLNNKVERLEKSIDQLDATIKNSADKLSKDSEKASVSSSRLTTALNRLTHYGILVAGIGVSVSLVQFLYESRIWPFSQ